MEEKQCTKCTLIKPIDQFYQRKSGNYWGYCKDCASKQRKENRNPNHHYTKGKTCSDCGKPITDTSTRCPSCAGSIHWRRIHPPFIKKCAYCHNDFQSQPSRDYRFCNAKCYRNYVKQNAKSWYIHKGYIRVVIEGKRILYHRIVMEQHLGRTLSKEEIVHHINGNTLDNRIKNLQIMTRGEHTTHHKKGATVPPEARYKMSVSAKNRKKH